MIWLICQYRYLYTVQSTSRDHWQSLVSLYGQAASQHRPYLESPPTDDETQTDPEPFGAFRHRHPRKLHPGRTPKKMPDIQENGIQTRLHDFGYQLSRCIQTRTDDWHVWTPWVYFIRRLIVVRRRPPTAPVLLEWHPAAAHPEVPPGPHLRHQRVHRTKRTHRS